MRNTKLIASIASVGIGVAVLGIVLFSMRSEPNVNNSLLVDQARSWDIELLKFERVRAAEWLQGPGTDPEVPGAHRQSARDKIRDLDALLIEKGISEPDALTMADVDEDHVWELKSASSSGDR